MLIYIDPGHGGDDPGANTVNPFPYAEKEFSLSLSLRLRDELKIQNHTIRLTRNTDAFIPLYDRAQMANDAGADIFVSIHANGSTNPATEGIEVFYYPGSTAGQSLANLILNSMYDEYSDHKNRGISGANFAVLRLTQMPAALVECEFITNPRQARFLADQSNQRILAEAIARGIQIYV